MHLHIQCNLIASQERIGGRCNPQGRVHLRIFQRHKLQERHLRGESRQPRRRWQRHPLALDPVRGEINRSSAQEGKSLQLQLRLNLRGPRTLFRPALGRRWPLGRHSWHHESTPCHSDNSTQRHTHHPRFIRFLSIGCTGHRNATAFSVRVRLGFGRFLQAPRLRHLRGVRSRSHNSLGSVIHGFFEVDQRLSDLAGQD